MQKKTSEFKSTHDLDLDIIDSSILFDVHDEYDKFRIGTCQGLFRVEKFTYDILNIDNTDIGNGHLQDALGICKGQPPRIAAYGYGHRQDLCGVSIGLEADEQQRLEETACAVSH